MQPRLIFVEGRTGAGKSSTAAHIGEWLQQRGEPVRVYREMDDDNPIRTRGIDAMRANHPHVKPLPDTGPDGFARDPAVYGPEQWSRLAADALEGSRTVVLESRYMQNSVLPYFWSGAPAAKVCEEFASIAERVASAQSLLVYLRPGDLESELRATLEQRPAQWSTWLLDSFTRAPWSRQRALAGMDALLAFYRAWEEVAERLCELHRGPTLAIEGAHASWPDALQRIRAAIRPWG